MYKVDFEVQYTSQQTFSLLLLLLFCIIIKHLFINITFYLLIDYFLFKKIVNIK